MAEQDSEGELAHLDPDARPHAAEPAAARLRLLQRKYSFAYTFAVQVRARLHELVALNPCSRPDNLLLIGETNNGKTNILNRFLAGYPRVDHPDAGAAVQPIVSVQAPARGDTAQFFLGLLSALRAPLRNPSRLAILEQRAKALLAGVGVRMIVIDEFHDMLGGSDRAQLQLRNTLKQISNEFGIVLVGAGINTARIAIAQDEQLYNRFEVWELPRWVRNEECQRLLVSFERVLPLRRPSDLDDPAMVDEILTRVETGKIGEIAKLLQSAARYAIESGAEHVSRAAVQACDYRAPSERA